MEINVIVIPNAKSSSITKIDEHHYKVKVDAPAVNGKANFRLIELLSDCFEVSKSKVRITKGSRNKVKTIAILEDA